MAETLTNIPSTVLLVRLVLPLVVWNDGLVAVVGGFLIAASCWVLREQATCGVEPWGFGFLGDDLRLGGGRHSCVGARIAGVGVGCVLFENCIVDASIFIFGVFLVFVVKLLRADGGCLGIRSR